MSDDRLKVVLPTGEEREMVPGWFEGSPTEPGWYWYWHRTESGPELYRVYRTPKKVMVQSQDGRKYNVRWHSGFWMGPIPVPPTVGGQS